MTSHRFITRSIIPFLTSVALVAAATTAASSPASAYDAREPHRVVHRDTTGDVLVFDNSDDSSRPAPHDTTNDITRTVVDHRSKRLSVKVRLAELSRTHYRLMLVEIRTPDRTFEAIIDYSSEAIDKRTSLETFGGREIPCSGLRWSLDRPTTTVAASIPRSCLDDPAWVRVGLGIVSAPVGLAHSRVDDSRRDGSVLDNHLTTGPRQPQQ